MLRRWFVRQVLGRRWACFSVMGLSFLVFAVATLNLAHLLQLNGGLWLDVGWQEALQDGAGRQLLELLASGYTGMVAWLVFKACETRLVQWLTA